MGLQFAESTDHYKLQVDITRKWVINTISSAVVGTIPDGSGKNAISVGAGIGRTVDYQTDAWVGFRVYFDSAQGWSGTGQLYQWSCANEQVLISVGIEHDGSISIFSGNNLHRVNNSGAGGFFLHPFVSYYIEIHSSSSGGTCVPPADISASATVHVNGIQWASGAGDTGFNPCDTVNQSNKGNFHFFANANIVNGHAWMRDFYIATGLADFYGDVGLGAIFPRQDSSNNGFISVGGTGDLSSCINPHSPDINDDTIYIKDNLLNDNYSVLFDQVDPTLHIPFVHYGVYHKKDAEGMKTFKLTMGGVEVGNLISSGDDYRYDFVPLDLGPGNVPWTPALLNGTSFGIKIEN